MYAITRMLQIVKLFFLIIFIDQLKESSCDGRICIPLLTHMILLFLSFSYISTNVRITVIDHC